MSAQRDMQGATGVMQISTHSGGRFTVQKNRLLTRKEVDGLSRLKNIRNRRGKRTRRSQAAFDELVLRNTRLVTSTALRYPVRGVELGDCFQEGIIGLIVGVEKYDHRRKCTLSTYATWWIRHSILRFLWDQRGDIHVGCNMDQTLMRIARARHKYHVLHGHYPTREEAARLIGLSPLQCRKLVRNSYLTKQIINGNEPSGDNTIHESELASDEPADTTAEHDRRNLRRLLGEVLVEAEAQCAKADAKTQARKMRNLSIVCDLAVGQESGRAVGRRYGISRQCVQQICKREFRLLRDLLKARNVTVDDIPTA
ncbi:MAG: sigma-70 family RNA polymerase sigma factor [Patescibacteria group bacterium]|nr:sigma-70 family RNA polymerase sigma factor [Patescibacteria group bacterium]